MKTITDEYIKLQQDLHQNPDYGGASIHFAPIVSELIKQCNIQSLSDYGAGKKKLEEALIKLDCLPKIYYPYDPAFPEYGNPQKAELICCIDVLEHIEPELIDNVINELKNLTTNYGFFTIHQGPARKILKDGRNAHLIQKPTSWWLEKLIKHFEVIHLATENNIMGQGFYVVVKLKKQDISAFKIHQYQYF